MTSLKIRLFLKILFTAVFLFITSHSPALAQDSLNTLKQDSAFSTFTQQNTAPDDEFNIFLLAIATVFVSVMIGATIVGAFAATLLLLMFAGLTLAGFLSASVVVGFYRKSVSSAFKTFLMMTCSFLGMIMGASGAWLVNHLFNLKLYHATYIIIGVTSGAAAGILLSIILYKMLQITLSYLKKRF